MSFTGTYWAQAVTSKQTNDETSTALQRLVTVPPRGFLQNYRTLSISSFNFVDNMMAVLRTEQMAAGTAPLSALPPLGVGVLEQAIRTQLEHILYVVRDYDSSNDKNTVYAANIMIYLDASSPAFIASKSSLQARTKCIEQHVDIGLLSGVLDLNLDLSVRSDSAGSADNKLTDLTLPVPKPLAGQSLAEHPALVPGAPFAFARRKAQIYGEQQHIFDVIERSTNFTDVVKSELRSIFKIQEKDVQTLICVPIYPSGSSISTNDPIGILNIHKNKKDKNANERYSELLPLLGVMTTALGNFVAEL